MHITPFAVEQWMNEYETRCTYNLAETCAESLTVEALLDLTGAHDVIADELLPMKLTYGAIEGTDRLRSAIAGLYRGQLIGNVIVTHGAIGANQLLYLSLVEPGDHVVSVVPNYQQHYSIPEALGAEVTKVELGFDADWVLDLEQLDAAVTAGTKVVTLSNPNNPTGALLDETVLGQVAAICDSAGAWLLCDEVYRGIDQHGPGTTASVADLYERGISVGSMSKAFSLAGLRLGWIAGPTDLLERVTVHRDYNTISVGMMDDLIASVALEHGDAILKRNRALVRANAATLGDWVATEDRIDWVRPGGGTTAFLRLGVDTSSREFCTGLVEGPGVMLVPGSVLHMEGYLRMGYANSPQVLASGLPLISEFLHG